MRILVIQTAFLGDQILTTPLVIAIKENIPDAHIAVLTTPVGMQVFKTNPAVESVIPYDKRKQDKGVKHIIRLTQRLKSARYDVAILAQGSIRSAIIAYLSGIPRRVGASDAAGRVFYTDKVVLSGKTQTERYLKLLKPIIGHTPAMTAPRLYPTDKEKVKAEALWALPSPLVAIAPGSVWETKRYPEASYIALGQMLVEYAGAGIVLIGGPDDVELCQRIAESISIAIGEAPGESNMLPSVVNAASDSVLLSAAVLDIAALLISNDSAPGHIASAVGTPVLTIFGPTSPEFGFVPYGEKNRYIYLGLDCQPCHHHGPRKCPRGDHRCMRNVSPETVVNLALEMLENL